MTDNKKNLEQQMQELETSQAESVPIEQVRELISGVKALFEGDFDAKDLELYGELAELAKFINNAKKELKDFQPHELADKHIPEASDQLDVIVKTTEKATNSIMDSCDQINGIFERIKDLLMSHEPALDPDIMASVDDAVMEGITSITGVYENCNFQDLTGQRINKIVQTLRETERHILRMVVVFGLANKRDDLDDETIHELEDDAKLLNGPAVPGNSLEQDDIDDLLNKLL